MQDTAPATKQYQCRHISTDGHRCGSPCLRGEDLCYYHHTTRKPVADPQQRRGRRSAFDLPLPEDRSAIQHSIGEVLRRIASNDIDPPAPASSSTASRSPASISPNPRLTATPGPNPSKSSKRSPSTPS